MEDEEYAPKATMSSLVEKRLVSVCSLLWRLRAEVCRVARLYPLEVCLTR